MQDVKAGIKFNDDTLIKLLRTIYVTEINVQPLVIL